METDKHQNLLQEKGGTGFPYLVFMDADGGVVAKHQGPRNAAGFAETGKTAKKYLDLKAKADGGDPQAKYELLLVQIDMGSVKGSDVRKQMGELKLADDQKKKLEEALVDLDIQEIASTVGRDKSTRIAAGKKYFEMKKEGKLPKSDRVLQPFWIFMMDYAEDAKDAALFEEAFNVLKNKFGDKMSKKFRDDNEARLKKLKEGK